MMTGKKILLLHPGAAFGAELADGFREAGAEVFPYGDGYKQGTEASAEAFAAKVKEEMGKIDCFVYIDPGVCLKGWENEFEDIAENMRATQTGFMLTVKHIGRMMAEAGGGGAVLFITDYTALAGCDVWNYDNAPETFDEDFTLVYGFQKGAYVNYARQAAGYLGEHGIRCNCIAYAPLAGTKPEAFEKAFIKHSHIKRMAMASDIKNAALFLASDAAAYITGVTLPVDGGYTAK